MDEFLKNRMDEVNRLYFGMGSLPGIRWSKGSLKKKYRKITFGTYDYKKDQVRIHPVLRDTGIPSIVLDYVLFHELLHYQDREILKAGHIRPVLFGRRKARIHTPDFHKREKDFPYKKEASKFMKMIASGTFQAEPADGTGLF
jgi:hypothetical protein